MTYPTLRLRQAFCATVILCCTYTSALLAAPEQLELNDGDTFVFLGDSITHRGPYSQYIETFFVTRYPERRIRFIPSGIGGDKAADALARFDEDVAVHAPDYVSVMLGMNDGQYKDFSQDIFGTYAADMAVILSRIQALDARPIIISPSIFDQQQYTIQSRDPDFRFNQLNASDQYNATMAFFGAWMRERAREAKAPYVNCWGPLNDLTKEQRQTTPEFTVAEDSIHPGPDGHAIMAAAFLEDLKPDRKTVSSVNARFVNGKWRATARNAEISDIKGSPEALSFTLKANSLPWVLPEEAALGYKLSKAGHRLSNESLNIYGLTPGTYEISIEGQRLSKHYTHIALGRNVELQSISDTPQYQQAAAVGKLVRERFETVWIPYRDLQAKMKGQRRKYGNDAPEVATFRKTIQPQLDEWLTKASDYSEVIYKASQPQTYLYSIRRID